MDTLITYFIPIAGVLGLLYTVIKSSWVNKQDTGTKKMADISRHIQRGAMAFLKAEYKVLSIFVLCVAILLGLSANEVTSHWLVAIAFVIGALCSGLAGFIGMRVDTKVNVRITHEDRRVLCDVLCMVFV